MTTTAYHTLSLLRQGLQPRLPQGVLVFVEGRPEDRRDTFIVTLKQVHPDSGEVFAVELPFLTQVWADLGLEVLTGELLRFIQAELAQGLPPALNNAYVRRPLR